MLIALVSKLFQLPACKFKCHVPTVGGKRQTVTIVLSVIIIIITIIIGIIVT
jgi:hypothetical protein